MDEATRHNDIYERAAEVIGRADAILITAGAGMGVDSGLPDFRGNEGFWRAYPPYAKLGHSFASMASPDWFASDPPLAWGFYGHRLGLYRKTAPHEGFAILRRWAADKPLGHWVFTSNVDGQFQRAGFDASCITECHGAIDFMQCVSNCGAGIFSADPHTVVVNDTTFRAEGQLPQCPGCGELARPNILMFGDPWWDEARSQEQSRRMRAWVERVHGGKLVVIECGAGKAIPTVRRLSEQIARGLGAVLVRINVRDPDGPKGTLSLAVGALAALREIDAKLGVA
jgi:NAD-dependent SIR2 family protein deacetylase